MTQKKKAPSKKKPATAKKAAPKKAAPKKKPVQEKLAEIPTPTQADLKEFQAVVEELKDVRNAIAKTSFFGRLTKWFRS
jgi:hypothetical protein